MYESTVEELEHILNQQQAEHQLELDKITQLHRAELHRLTQHQAQDTKQ